MRRMPSVYIINLIIIPVCFDRLSGNNYCRETESLCVIIANSRVKVPAHGRSVIRDETLRSAHDIRGGFDSSTVHKPKRDDVQVALAL